MLVQFAHLHTYGPIDNRLSSAIRKRTSVNHSVVRFPVSALNLLWACTPLVCWALLDLMLLLFPKIKMNALLERNGNFALVMVALCGLMKQNGYQLTIWVFFFSYSNFCLLFSFQRIIWSCWVATSWELQGGWLFNTASWREWTNSDA